MKTREMDRPKERVTNHASRDRQAGLRSARRYFMALAAHHEWRRGAEAAKRCKLKSELNALLNQPLV